MEIKFPKGFTLERAEGSVAGYLRDALERYGKRGSKVQLSP